MKKITIILLQLMFLNVSLNTSVLANQFENLSLVGTSKNEGNGEISSGTIVFNNGTELSQVAKSNLIRLAADMRDFPHFKVVIKGNGSGGGATQEKATAYIHSMMAFMTHDLGIPESRFEIDYSGTEKINTLTYSPGEATSPRGGLESNTIEPE